MTARQLLWAPERRPRPARQRKIDCWAQLHDVLRQSLLWKSYTRGAPVYSAGGRICSTEVAEKAIRWGLVVPADRGLFDDGDAQTYQLRQEP